MLFVAPGTVDTVYDLMHMPSQEWLLWIQCDLPTSALPAVLHLSVLKLLEHTHAACSLLA